jgi:hypothetical protein
MAKRTIRRRVRKSKTIRKVMRGCNGRILNKDMKPLHKSMDKAMKKLHKSMRRRGRSRAKVGGAAAGTIEAAQYPGAPPEANENLASGTTAFLQAQQMARNSPPVAPVKIVNTNMAPLPQQGGARTRRHHRRRLRYKKSMARKSRRA